MALKSLASAVALSLFLSGCLTTVPDIPSSSAGSVQTRQRIVDGIQSPTIDSNGVLLTPWVRSAMMSAFAMRAAHLGLRIDPNGVPVRIRITSVRSKSDAARIAFNFLDGAEWVSGTVTVGDASFDVQEDTWLHWMPTGYRSIQEVADAVGRQVANGVALVGGMPLND
ncbi:MULTISPECIES: hypothetical protein [Caballeronia]|jgi:hypothetical protein|uniref:Lipoprotein n=1 Tax=Caballeronia jiangsuensis TaxID=1458357 RepID=A0ABW9CHT6_9BURK|nr:MULTISPECIES: hypothetical protein [Caballeronia]KAK44661.1 hypothetical protein BG58_23535 [Caballeronia jiangsuensis]MBC8642078.1 hypothetical protein [Caballeronia sp. EK]MDR5742468.1 hypothetical protein [Caballeronia sp. LZ029]GJH08762.1 hypothetical protein CBA19CS11_08010 [Caballeronia novacaledonica]